MKTYEIKMSRSRWMSLLIAVLLVVMLVQLCLPYFTYGKDTLTFVPPEGGNEKLLDGTWVLSGSDPSQDGYKEIVIKSGKMTVNTTNIIRVNQLNADEAVKTVKGDYEAIAKSLNASEEAYLKVTQLQPMMQEVYDFVSAKTGLKAETAAAEAPADATSGEAAPAASSGNADFDTVATSLKKVNAAVDTAKTNYESALAALETAQASVNAAREGAVEAYTADASAAWITETTEAKTEALYETYLPDYEKENTARIRNDMVEAAKAKELEALKKAEKEALKAAPENAGKKNAEIEAMIDIDKLAAQIDMDAINAAISDEKVAEELDKQFSDMLAAMLGEARDSVIFNKLDEQKAISKNGAAKAAAALKLADDAAKEAEKTYQKKAEKAFTDAVKEYNKALAIAQAFDAEKTFGVAEEITAEIAGAPEMQYEEYDNTSTEKAMMTTEGKAKYTEKKSSLKLTFANGEEYEVNFGASFAYNQVKRLSILGYVGFPYNVEDFTTEMTYRIENFYINDVVLLPIVLLVLGILGVVVCFIKRDKMSSGFLPVAFGIVGVIGYLTSDFLKLGDGYATHIICYAVIFVISALHIVLCAKEKKAK